MTMEYDEGQVFRLYGCYGMAAVAASNLEQELVFSILFAEFLTKVAEEGKKNGRWLSNRQYRRAFERFQNEHFSKTMGKLVEKVQAFPHFDKQLKQRVNAARKQRNFLIHDFWRERAPRLLSVKGRASMIEELHKMTDTFEALSDDMRASLKVTRQNLGFDDAQLESQIEAIMGPIGRAQRQ